MPKLIFNDATHEYFLDGLKIPGFSEVSRAMGISNYSGIPESVLEVARQFGDAAHYMTKLWDLADLDVKSMDAPLNLCLEAYKHFLKDYKVEIIKEYIENPICSYIYRYGVTPDRICLIRGELSVLELKFVSKLLPGVALQTAAQKRAAEEFYKIKIKHRYALQITSAGQSKPPVEYKNKMDEQVFIAALSLYNWRQNNEK